MAKARRGVWAVVFGFISISLVLWVLLLISPIGATSVSVTVDSSVSGFSQMYFATSDTEFAEERTAWAPLLSGPSELRFPFSMGKGTVGDRQRWDPCDCEGTFVVKELSLQSGLAVQDIPLSAITPQLDITGFVQVDKGLEIKTGSNDGQVVFSVDTAPFYRNHLLMLLGIALAGSAVLILIASLIRMWRREPLRGAGERLVSEAAPLVAVPSWATAAAGLVVALGVGLLLVGSQAIGVSWDEPFYVDAMQSLMNSGWFVPKAFFIDGVAAAKDVFVHGPIASILGHEVAVLRGAEDGWSSLPTAEAYAARHLAVAGIALAGLIAVALTASVALRSWRWGLVAAAAVVSVPLWTGHGMFNIQDIPVATGFSFVTLGLVLLSRPVREAPRSRLAGACVSILGGTVLCIGDRPGAWVSLGVSAIVLVGVLALADARVGGTRWALGEGGARIGVIAFGLLGAMVVLWIAYPLVFGDPATMLVQSVVASASFPWVGETLTAGVLMPAQPPWSYLPIWFGSKIPLVLLVLFVLGLVAVSGNAIRATVKGRRDDASQAALAMVAPLTQAVATPVGAVLIGATMYDGIRQFLFVLPALALVAVAGLWFVQRSLAIRRQRWGAAVVWGVVIVGLGLPAVAQVRLFPYSFAYVNAAAALRPIDGNWLNDGWWLSGRELLEKSPTADRVVCQESPEGRLVDCETLDVLAPFWQAAVSNADVLPLEEGEILVLSRFDVAALDPSCEPIDTVSRRLFGRDVTLSTAAVCRIDPSRIDPSDAQ